MFVSSTLQVLTLGADGALLGTANSGTENSRGPAASHLHQHMADRPAAVVNVNGAGDCLVAGALAGIICGQSPLQALAIGMVK
jgi:sugar/nucleoside kinase (ribokinase family)